MRQVSWRKVLPIAVCLALTALGMGLGLQLREPQNYWDGSILGQHELLLTIGTRAHAAGTPDYVCDGTDDNVEFQTALNALPAGGGKLVVLGGTYNFSATVTRLIDDVTIEGMGQSTYFVYNGADPIFTNGGNNWTYRDFRTDAGGVNLNSTTGYVLENLLLGTTAYGVTSQAGGGVFTSVSGNMNASNITAGTVDPARLGSGTANSTNVLYGDSTWGPVSASGNATWGSITGNMTTQADLTAALNGKVNTSTTVNGQALSGNVTISGADVGLPDGVAVGDILSWNGTAWNYVSAGDAGQVLTANSTSSLPYWSDSTVSSGTTMPATAVVGQQFYQDTTGRDVLYTYDGSTWYPQKAFGSYTTYVDKTDGTDDQNHGTGVDGAAYASITYAISQVPEVLTAGATIYINNEVYAEAISFARRVQDMSDNLTGITFQGTLVLNTGGLAGTGGNAGTGATLPYIDDAGLVAGTFDNKLVKFTSGANNGLYRVADNNTTTRVNLAGPALTGAPGAGDTYEVYDWGTTVTAVIVVDPASWVNVNDIKITGATSDTNSGTNSVGNVTIYTRTLIDNDANGWAVSSLGYIEIHESLYVHSANDWMYGIITYNKSVVAPIEGTKFHLTGGANCDAVLANESAFIEFSNGNIIHGFVNGILCQGASYTRMSGSVNNVIRNGSRGVYAVQGSTVIGTASNTYTSISIANESADAASFSYID